MLGKNIENSVLRIYKEYLFNKLKVLIEVKNFKKVVLTFEEGKIFYIYSGIYSFTYILMDFSTVGLHTTC